MSDDERPLSSREALARKKLLGVLSGTWVAQGVYAVVKLGIPDLLSTGPRTVDQLARDSGADRAALARLLRALSLTGLFTEPEPDAFALTPTSELLRDGVPGSVRLNALMQGEEVFRCFAEIMHTVRTGEPAFQKVFGQSFYDYLGEHPDAAYTFNTSMGHQQAPDALATCEFGPADIVVDVGGGNGTLLVELLRERPGMRGILVELPEAIPHAEQNLSRAGIADRVTCLAGDFFSQIPPGGDVYVLSRILHNWADASAIELLRAVHEAMSPGARLLVLEDFLPDDSSTARAGAGLVDLLMLLTLEGRDRTEAGYRELLGKVGFDIVAVRHATSGVLEARRT